MAESASLSDSLKQLEKVLEEYFVKKAPALPENIKELLVQFAPWLTVIGVIIGLPAILALLGLGSFLSMMPFASVGMGRWGGAFFLSTLLMVVTLVLEALAIPGLFAKTRQGWLYIYYAVIVSAVASLVTFDIFGFLIGTLIGMYLLFQVKKFYK